MNGGVAKVEDDVRTSEFLNLFITGINPFPGYSWKKNHIKSLFLISWKKYATGDIGLIVIQNYLHTNAVSIF